MTERELRERVAQEALALLGRNEADGSFRAIIDAYNGITPLPRGYRMSYSDPWCAAFVSAVGAMAGFDGLLLPECACDRMIALYRARGLFRREDGGRVQTGDLIFYDWNGDGSADHVGLVTAADAAGCEVVEGNSGDAVSRRRVSLGWDKIAGFAFPDYAAAVDEVDEPEAEDAPWAPPVLRRGSRGLGVTAMQGVLIARGCGCGPDGADGDFGPNTEAALRRFQRENGLAEDGVCGGASWKRLLGVSA